MVLPLWFYYYGSTIMVLPLWFYHYGSSGARLVKWGALGQVGRAWSSGARLVKRGALGQAGRAWSSGARLVKWGALGQVKCIDDNQECFKMIGFLILWNQLWPVSRNKERYYFRAPRYVMDGNHFRWRIAQGPCLFAVVNLMRRHCYSPAFLHCTRYNRGKDQHPKSRVG